LAAYAGLVQGEIARRALAGPNAAVEPPHRPAGCAASSLAQLLGRRLAASGGFRTKRSTLSSNAR
jgi:hypothetical protein